MNLFYLLPIFTISMLILKTIKQHIHILPQDTFAIEKYFSFSKKEYIYKISEPNKIYFSISRTPFVKYIAVPSHIQELYCNGLLKDYVDCIVNIKYNIEIVDDQEKLRNIYYLFPYVTKIKNAYLLDEDFSMHFNGIIREFLCHYSTSQLRTTGSLEVFKDKLIEKLEKECNHFFKINVMIVGISFNSPITYDEKRKPAEMNVESLIDAEYNLQQINQILRANDEGIILSHINPIVPEHIIRKIREKYNNNKTKLDQLIEQLSIKTKTQEEINDICNKIASL